MNNRIVSLATSKITKEIRDNINAALDENRISQGRFVKEFEEKVAKYVGAKYAVAVCNGTIADMVALLALSALKPGKTEVIVPALTFVAQPNSVLFAGLKPIFVDVDVNCQMDFTKIEEKINDNTLAIMPANLLGIECEIEKIKEIAQRHDLFVVEDNCEAFGVKCHGDVATYSFFPSHTITTGEGGMAVTNNEFIYDMLKKAINHVRRNDDKILDKFHFDTLGVNGKLNNLSAAVGCATIGTADWVIETRLKNVDYLNHYTHNFWYKPTSPHCYPTFYENSSVRDAKLQELKANDIEGRKLFSCLPTMEKVYSYMGYKKGEFPMAEEIAEKGLFVPVHQDLTQEDLDKICSLI